MGRTLRVGEMQLAIEGLAIARSIFSGDDASIDARVDGIRSVILDLDSDEEGSLAKYSVKVNELDLIAGYQLWAATYDALDNALIAFEGPIVRELVGPGPWGDVLDACTGTGRHLAWLVKDAASATGLDQSPEMLAIAKAKVPGASFLLGSLCDDHNGDLPDASFDLIVCSLALAHFPNLDEPVAALARLVRPGGRIVLSDSHPLFNALDGQAFFPHEDGSTPFVRNYDHLISDYLRSFRRVGLVVDECLEPRLGPNDGPMNASVMASIAPDAVRQAFLGLTSVLAWSLHRPI